MSRDFLLVLVAQRDVLAQHSSCLVTHTGVLLSVFRGPGHFAELLWGSFLEHCTLQKSWGDGGLAPIPGICKEEFAAVHGVLSSLQWCLVAAQIQPGSKQVPSPSSVSELTIPVCPLEDTPGILWFLTAKIESNTPRSFPRLGDFPAGCIQSPILGFCSAVCQWDSSNATALSPQQPPAAGPCSISPIWKFYVGSALAEVCFSPLVSCLYSFSSSLCLTYLNR